MCCRKMSHTPEPKSSRSSAAAATTPPQTMIGFQGPGLVGVRVDVARMQAAPALLPPSSAHAASSAVVSSPPSPTVTPREHRTKAQAPREGNPADTRLTHQTKRHTQTPATLTKRATPRQTTPTAHQPAT